MKNSLLLILALCSTSVLASPVDNSRSLPLQDSDEDTKDSPSTVQGNANTVQASHLQTLNNDCLLEVFSKSTFPDVLRFRATSKSIQSISTETVEMPFLDIISKYNGDDPTDRVNRRLRTLIHHAIPYAEHILEDARTISRSTFNVRTFEQVLVGLSRQVSLFGLFVCQPPAQMHSDYHGESAPTTLEPSWPQNESQVKDFLVSALAKVAESFKNDENGHDHNAEFWMELAVALILHQHSAPILFTRPSIVNAVEAAKYELSAEYRIDLDLSDEDMANIQRAKVETLGPDHEKILGLLHIVHGALYQVKWRIKRKQLEKNADVEAEMIALMVPELGMDQESIKKVFKQARWPIRLGLAVKYRLAHAVRDLLKDKDIFNPAPMIEKQYNAAIKSKCEPLIKAFEESGLVKTTEQ